MKSDFSEFSPVDKHKWVEKIISDLKGKKDYSDLDYKIDENISLEAVQMSSEYPVEKPLNVRTPQWGTAVNISDDIEANKVALKFLETGLHSLRFSIIDNTDFDVLFPNILPEYVTLHLDFSACSASGLNRFTDWYSLNIANKKHTFIIQSNEEKHLPENHLRILYQFNTQDSVSTRLSDMLQSFYVKKESLNINNVAVLFEAGKDFLTAIAIIRAIRILWANFLKMIGKDTTIPIFIIVQPSVSSLTSDQNLQLIELTYIQLSAYLGTADLVYGLPVSDAENKEYARLSLNIHHIFNEESKLNKVLDPAAGSYFIENATNKIAEESWDKYISQI
ncbi:MAG: hypothetical protein IPM42_11080 [Saprospiraceae bacterium]|nr:hypothetical protein [Saprospiraceae bacterium]